MSNFNTTTERVFSELQQPASKDVSDGNATIINALFTKETGVDRLNYFLKLEPKDIYKLIQEPTMLENITKDIIIPNECPVQTAQEFCYHVIMKKIGLVGKHKEIESEMSIALRKVGLTNSNENEMICSETRIAYQKIVDLIYNDRYKLNKNEIKTIIDGLEVLPIDEIVKILKYVNDEQIAIILEHFDDDKQIASVSDGISHAHRILK